MVLPSLRGKQSPANRGILQSTRPSPTGLRTSLLLATILGLREAASDFSRSGPTRAPECKRFSPVISRPGGAGSSVGSGGGRGGGGPGLFTRASGGVVELTGAVNARSGHSAIT